MKSKIRLLFFTCCLAATFLSCQTSSRELSSSDIARSSALQTILKRGVLRVGLEAGYIPFEMRAKDGRYIGFDVEIAQTMAERLGVKLEIVNTNWDGIIPALNTGRFDIIISGMTRTTKRAKSVNFSKPYFVTGQALLLNREKCEEIKSYKDLNSKDKIVAVKLGTTGDFAAQKYIPDATIKKFESEAEASMEVAGGKAHAFVYDEPYIRRYAEMKPDNVRALLEPFTYEPLAFAIRKGDPDFLEWLNLFIDDIQHDHPEVSTYRRLYEKYFVRFDWQSEL